MLNFFRKWSLLGLLILLLSAFFYFDLKHYLTFETLKKYHNIALNWTNTHYFSAVILYLLIFTGLIACAIPSATFMALVGGFLFGNMAILYATLGTTLGGFILFIAIKSSLGKSLAARSIGWLKKMENGFRENAFHYLIMMRLIPVFPCWISNISAGVMNVPISTFIFATMIGIFPSTVIYVLVGRGLDKFFNLKHPPTLEILLTPSLLLPLIGLTILSLIPIFYRRFNK